MKYLYIIILIFILGCDYFHRPIKENDIYTICPKQNKIKLNMFEKSYRIMKSKNHYYLWVDLFSDGSDKSAPHLLVCDNNLKLLGASYFENKIIDYISGDTLFGWYTNEWNYSLSSNHNNKSHYETYRNDLPYEIKFKLDTINEPSGSISETICIIDSINVLDNNLMLQFYTRKENNIYKRCNSKEEYLQNEKYYSDIYKINEIIQIPIDSIYSINYQEFTTLSFDKSYYYFKSMVTLNDSVVKKFYFDIYKKIKKD